ELGFASYADAVATADLASTPPVFQHVVSEARRVMACVDALKADQAECFGRLLLEGHASLRDRLQVSCEALDRLVDAAMASGALGARLTGAGFGGCAVVLCRTADRDKVRDGLIERFYAGRSDYLIDAEPGPGAIKN
ncbi:MAG TPA: hypothetical protein VKE70_23465, partial [Candidatus Solibacter sp.]|nr:hypothetical protein [Candidatus Solibacter sp.]